MLFDSIFRNVNVTLLCITNTPTMLYVASPEKWSHLIRGGSGAGEELGPLFLNFLDPPLVIVYQFSSIEEQYSVGSLYALHAYNNIIGLQCMQMNSNNSYQFSSIQRQYSIDALYA